MDVCNNTDYLRRPADDAPSARPSMHAELNKIYSVIIRFLFLLYNNWGQSINYYLRIVLFNVRMNIEPDHKSGIPASSEKNDRRNEINCGLI